MNIMELDVHSILSNSKIALVTHVFTIGPTQELEKYLNDKCKRLVVISHPFYSASADRSYYKVYSDRESKNSQSRIARKQPVVDFVFDLLKTLGFILSQKEKYEFFVGAGTLNAFAGLILKRLGIAKFVIFYSIDYVPKRFDNSFLNGIYHWMDRICASKCDAVWNLSARMIEERARHHANVSNNMQQVVPVGTNFKMITRLQEKEIDRYSLVYLGTLAEKQGLQLAIESFPDLIKRHPLLKLIIIGDGPLRERLTNLCKSLGVEHAVEFRGEIKDDRQVEKIMTRCVAGIATYKPDKDNFAQFTDVGKPKYYTSCGLPPIITAVPPVAKLIEEQDAGYVIQYQKQEFIDSVNRILEDPTEYSKKRENAIRFASNFHWDAIFEKAFSEMLRNADI